MTITIAHIMFSISFVAVVVRARVLTLDRSLEEAAADLGASPWTTFWQVTFPIILPAVLSGVLLAFALSIDDFVVTNFTAGTTTTFPLWIWGATRVGLPPQVNVMGTLIFAVGVLIAVLSSVRARRRRRRLTMAGRALADAAPRAVLARPSPARRRRPSRCTGVETADLAVVGAGYSGLWTALLAKERDPGRDVVVLEARHGRLGGVRPQRRLLLGQPHPRLRQRR